MVRVPDYGRIKQFKFEPWPGHCVVSLGKMLGGNY